MKKILVVEDNDKNLRLIRDILRYYKYEVIEAVNGEEAVTYAVSRLPDLILMDIQMPVMDGFKALKLLRENPATKDIKAIALTSFAMAGDREKILSAGFNDYISKPMDTRALPAMMKKYLGE
ncbi:MAG: response regulator [Thermodesulfovibrionia bacterium]|nr:response regulator [Thermodesulfovibrionia bacterium]